MGLLGNSSGHYTVYLVLFLAHFTARSHAQAALDYMDMEATTLDPPEETTAPCKEDEVQSDEVQTQPLAAPIMEVTDYPNHQEQKQKLQDATKPAGLCGSPPDVGFAKLKSDFLAQTVFPKGATVSYECQANYEYAPGAKGTVTCMDDGEWSFPDAFCKPNFCGPPPRLDHGLPREDYLERTIFPKGTEVKYVCRPGYVRSPGANSVARCNADTTWSLPETFCKRKSCGNPGEVINGRMEGEDFDFGSRVTFFCNPGYRLASKRNYRDCQEDGKWSNDLPECTVVYCPQPPDIANGHYYQEREEYTYLDTVKYVCRGNLALIGEQTISCTEEGKWSSNAPQCKFVQCPNPHVENSRKVSGIMSSYSLNSAVRFQCRHQYKMIGSDIVKCNQSSKWEPELPKCVGTCQFLPRISNAELVEPTSETIFLEGTTLKFRCSQGYEPVSGEVTTATCSRLQWLYSSFCKPITCAHPDPVPNGKMISGSFTFGNIITYSCETGYIIKNQKYRTCRADGSWSLPVPECEVQKCPTPRYVMNGWYGPQMEEYIYNDTITYDCHEGYQLVGQASMTCLHDGRWNYQAPECRGICKAPTVFPHAQMNPNYYHYNTLNRFYAGTTIQYMCKPGYYRDYSFTDTITCLGNYTWSKLSNEFCQIRKCPNPAFLKNGWYEPEMPEYVYNDTITYDCNEGFQLVGQSLITCTSDGRWNYNTPECRGICDNPPDLYYAELDFSSKQQTTFFAGSTVQYNCRPGFFFNSMGNRITCLGNFTWSNIHIDFCNRTSCGRPPKVANAIFEAKDFLFESEAVYKCEKGFKMISQRKSVKCGLSGKWTGALPVCEVQKCSPPEDLEDGSYSIKKDDYTYSESVTYKCDSLQLVGKASVSCSEEGKWTSGAPKCQAVCTFPPVLDFAVVEDEFINQEYFDSGKTVQYKCRPGFVPVSGKSNTLTCLENLKWSQHEVFCTRLSCGDPGAIDNGKMQSENFLFGSIVNYTCNPGYSMISRNNYRECQADGTWSGKPPVCKEPVCDHIWELQEEARRCTSTPDEWIKYLQVQYLYLQIENLKLDIEMKKRQLDSPTQTSSILHK